MNLLHGYYRLLHHVLENGARKEDRTGTGTISLSGESITVPVEVRMIPLVCLKKTSFPIIIKELAWMLSSGVYSETLSKLGVKIWDEWGDENDNGYLGKIYGYQWRIGFGIDQIEHLIKNMRKDKYSRRHIVTAWNPRDLSEMNLPPCHRDFQMVYNEESKSFDMVVAQRSADLFLGVPYNIGFYALLGKLLNASAGCLNKSFSLRFNYGDAHIYSNHVDQVKELLKRYYNEVNSPEFARSIDEHVGLDEYLLEDDVRDGLTMFPYEERFLNPEQELHRTEYMIDYLFKSFDVRPHVTFGQIKAPVAV